MQTTQKQEAQEPVPLDRSFTPIVTINVSELQQIARLISSIFHHGDFKAETPNERELEGLLRSNGYYPPKEQK